MTGLSGNYSRTTLAPMLRTPSAYRVPMGGGGGFNLAKFLGGAGKVGGFLANPFGWRWYRIAWWYYRRQKSRPENYIYDARGND